MRSVWLSPGFPAAPTSLLESLGTEYVLAPPLTSPPAGCIAVVTGFERDLLARLAARPAGTSLLVITPPDTPLPASEISGLRADAVVPAASIAEVAEALRRLPASAAPAAAGQDLPWWIRPPQGTTPRGTAPQGTTPRGTAPQGTAPQGATGQGTASLGATGQGAMGQSTPPQDSAAQDRQALPTYPVQDRPAPTVQLPHDTAMLATTPLPAFGQPVYPPGAAPTETLAMGSAAPGRRRFALTGRQARIASIAAVVVAMAATGVAVGLDSHSSSQTNTAATTGPGRGNNPAPFGNSNGSNGFDGRTGQNGQGNGTAPQFGAPGQMGGQNRQGDRRQELQQFLTCLRQNGVSIGGNNRPFFDPADPQLRTALTKCASALPFGRFRGGFAGGPHNGTGTGGIGSSGTGTGGIGSSGTGTGGIGSGGTGSGGTSENGSHST